MSSLPPPSFDPPHVPPPGGSPVPPPLPPSGAAPLPPPVSAPTGIPAVPFGASSPAGPPPGPPPSAEPTSKPSRTKLFVGIGVVAALAAIVGFVVTRGGDDTGSADVTVEETDAPDDTEAPDTTPDTTPDTPAPTTSAPVVTTGAPLTLPTTVAPPVPQVDLGQGVAFTLPDGYTQATVNNGVEITDGTLRFFVQVSTRDPGADPLVFAQEYIDSFDSTFAAASYSQAVPAALDTTGAAPSDGYFISYRVMNTDGTGFVGLIDATRRADGLVYLTDLYSALDADPDAQLPDGLYDEFYGSFLDAPLIGDVVDLTPLTVTRPVSTHPTFVLDGVVALSPPAGWTVDQPGPQRVAFSKPDGQRFVAARLADSADPLVSQDLAFATMQELLPGVTIAGFTPSRENEDVVSFDSTFTAVDPSGRAIEGVARVWTDTVRAQVFVAVSFNFTDTPPSLDDEDFLIRALDESLIDDR